KKALCIRRFVGEIQKWRVRHSRYYRVQGEREHGDAVYVGQTRGDGGAARRAPEAIGIGRGAPGGTIIAGEKRPTAHPAAYLSGKQWKASKGSDAPTGCITRTHSRLVQHRPRPGRGNGAPGARSIHRCQWRAQHVAAPLRTARDGEWRWH